MKILILGANGMIGNAIYRRLSAELSLNVYGGVRDLNCKFFFPTHLQKNLLNYGNLLLRENQLLALSKVNPDIVINCVGLTKHKFEENISEGSLEINSVMPHHFSSSCNERGIRFIHISTDCVFSGLKGGYVESDAPDALDLYGKSKAMGEVVNDGSLTLRTSTIGHELCTKYGLLEWFLSQDQECVGFSKAIFSGLPSVIFAEVILNYVLFNSDLKGLFHIAAEPINKYDLLVLIAKIYDKKIDIKKDCEFIIDRSLNCDKFMTKCGFIASSWPDLIKSMYNDKLNH